VVYRSSDKTGATTFLKEETGFLRFAAVRLTSLVIIGSLLSLAGFLVVQSGTEKRIRSDFLLSSDAQIQVIQRELDDNFGVLKVLRAYFESAKEDSPAAFDKFATQTMSAYHGLRSLEWAPRVRDPDRKRFEASLAARTSGSAGIVAGANGNKPIHAFGKSEYFPVEYICPWNREDAFVGYDVLSNPAAAAALKRAIATGEPSSTGKLRFWDPSGDTNAIATFLAVYDAPDKGRSEEWRTQHVRGVVISAARTSELLASALRNFTEQGVRTYVFDISATDPRQLLYTHSSFRAPKSSQAEYSPESLLQEKLVYAQKLPAGGRDWQIILVGSDFTTSGSNWQPSVFLFCALAATFGIALYFRMMSRYTRDLAKANVNLRSQAHDRQKEQDELAFQALHDPLTGLPNRRQFGKRFDEAIEEARRTGDSLALFFVDLDGFKIINDTLGHAVGDTVLKTVAERLSKNVGRRDVVARTGGDEFNILLVEAGSGNLAERVAQGLLDAVSKPIEVGDRILTVSASIGISLFPLHGQDFKELAHCSDAAMYFAKKRGKNRFHRYTKELAVTAKRGMELALSLRGAIERNELCLFFQPVLGLGVDATLRFEALLRWRHPQIGLLGPGHFLAIAEETGLTAPIGRWVLHEACRLASSWQGTGHRSIGVSVNVSGHHFAHPEFMDSIDSALAQHKLDPSLLEVEMSESAVVAEIEESLVRLGDLRRKGVSVAVDDFGTGYSSLTYLETLPIDALKIDRSFLPRSESNFRRSSLLRSLIALGKSLNLRVIVGGIEVARQFELVRGMGPNEVQGFLFSKPLSGAAVPEFIERWNQRQGSADTDRLMETTRFPADLVLVSSRSQVG
jgi:diguanylate cyclase (GGDEF)-like protein